MARYSVEFRRSADKDLRRLDATTQRRLLRAIDPFADDPCPAGCRKLQGSEDAYPIRAGDHRVVYTVEDAVLIVAIERVRHRREVYRQ